MLWWQVYVSLTKNKVAVQQNADGYVCNIFAYVPSIYFSSTPSSVYKKKTLSETFHGLSSKQQTYLLFFVIYEKLRKQKYFRSHRDDE